MAADDNDKRDVPAIEKLIAATGLLLVLLVSGALAYEALNNRGGPPNIVVRVNDIRPVDDGFLVVFSASNTGETTAAQVSIKGELWADERIVEERSTILSYVPDGGRQEGGLFFEHQPEKYRLRLRASGYEKP